MGSALRPKQPPFVLEVDPESGSILRVDPGLEALLGFAAGTMGGRRVADVFEPASARRRSAARILAEGTHDLVAPLNQASILSALLVRKAGGAIADAGASEILDHMQAAVQRMRTMAEGLKTISRALAEPMSPVPVEADALLAEALRACAPRIEAEGVEMVAGPLPAIVADRRRIVWVFQELIENAIRFRGPSPLRVEISAEPRGGRLVFSVRDNGRGFDPRSAPEAFRIFCRKESGHCAGSGVGLTICREIVEQHGGEMWAESTPGEGTGIYFSLPGASRYRQEVATP